MPLSVIGAGFGRTGTLTLKSALEELGFGPCYHMAEVLKNPAAPAWWEAAYDGEAVDWEQVFEGYSATVDWPGATFYRQLAEAYPQAKVVLSVRDPEAWFNSTQATIFNDEIQKKFHQITAMISPGHMQMAAKVVRGRFGGEIHDKERLIRAFNEHNGEVRRTIPAERLLVYEVSQGWEPLCAFLEVPVPATPMPSANSSDEFNEAVDAAASGRT
jgi:hypothetical protein